MLTKILTAGFCLCFLLTFTSSHAENEYWQSLGGPYWVKGVDVAYGAAGEGRAWHRYLIGNDGNYTKLFYWRSIDPYWFAWAPLPAANKIISYRYFGNTDGNYAFSTSYNDRVWGSSDGGWSWAPVPNSELIPNRQFKTIEVDINNPGTRCFVGCDALANEASTYEGILVEGNWTWNQIGDGLEGLDINDLESPAYPGDWLTAATNNGIRRCYLDDDPTWEEIQGDLSEHEIVAIEPIEHDQFMWAATGIIDGHRRLYYSYNQLTPWVDYVEIEVGDPPSHFDKEVNDMAVILQFGNFQSVYIAAQEGLYLLDIKGVDHVGEDFLRHYIDFQNDPDYPEAPFRYDFPVLSVDYYKESDQSPVSYILVGTVNNVYLITETREDEYPFEIASITFTDITEGTFLDSVTSTTFPDYCPPDTIILTNSPRGLIKKGGSVDWQLKATSNYQHPTYTGTDIVSEKTEPFVCHVIAASSDGYDGDGAIMYSSDFGETWEGPNDFQSSILAVELHPNNNVAYAGGYGDRIYVSLNNGETWRNEIILDGRIAHVNDILADPDPDREDIFYIAGSIIDEATVKVSAWNGSNWIHLDNGLIDVTQVNELCKNASDNALYAATNIGVFKADVTDLGDVQWVRKTGDVGNPDLGSIVIDPEDLYVLFASTSPSALEPTAYVSADSGRSWIEYTTGELGENGALANKLAYAQRLFPAVVAGTDKGVYFLPDIVKSGQFYTSELWGPGKIVINGDVAFYDNVSLTILAPCTLSFVYDFDYRHSGLYSEKTELIMNLGAKLTAEGDINNPIVLTSSRPLEGNAGDWVGIEINSGQYCFPELRLDYCTIEYATIGISGVTTAHPGLFRIEHCVFRFNELAGINLFLPSYSYSAEIKNSLFQDCGSYGIRIRHDFSNYPSIGITGNEIVDCDYGIWYSGNGNESGSKEISICENIIRQTTQGQGNYGLYISKYDPSGYSPVANIESDSITYFQQGGIYLNSVSSSSILTANKVKHNGSYGLYLSNSSPDIVSDGGIPNVFTWSPTGIYCGTNSCPYVRSTKIKENSVYGVLIEPGAGICIPDFGTRNDEGGNSFYCSFADPFYDDMENTDPIIWVYAIGNWWGEVRPDERQIDGNIYYRPWLTSDPLPGYEKRGSAHADIPADYNLQQNFPNPFNPNTEISFYLPETGFTDLKIYNLTGQLVKKLISGNHEAGEHIVVWDGKNAEGEDVSSGIYFYILSTEEKKIAKKMTLVR